MADQFTQALDSVLFLSSYSIFHSNHSESCVFIYPLIAYVFSIDLTMLFL